MTPDMLQTQSADGTLLGKYASPTNGIQVPDDFPLYLWARFDKVITKQTQRKLLQLWDVFQPLAEHTGNHGRDKNRGPTDAYHFGIWEHYGQHPRVTQDSIQQSPEAIKALDGLLDIVAGPIATSVNNLLMYHAPRLYSKQQM